MSCGCGGFRLPNSILLRMEAAKIATAMGATITTISGTLDIMVEVHKFLLGDVKEADLDKPCSHGTGDKADSVRQRQNLIDSPLVVIRSLREPDVELIEQATRAKTIGQLVLCEKPKGMKGDAAARALDWLAALGLDMGMTNDELRNWIVTGKRYAIDAH